jgi:hypothetical protein
LSTVVYGATAMVDADQITDDRSADKINGRHAAWRNDR